MKNSWSKTIAIISIAILFHICFYQKGFGINAFIFTIASFLITFSQQAWKNISTIAKVTALITLLLSAMLFVHAAVWTQILWFIGFILSIGLIHANKTQFLLFAFMQFFTHIIHSISNGYKYLIPNKSVNISAYQVRKWGIYAGTTLIIGFAFFMLYSLANPDFQNTIVQFAEKAFTWIPSIGSFSWWAFGLLGLIIAITIAIPDSNMVHFFQEKEAIYAIDKIRKRKSINDVDFRPFKSSIALKSEFQFAVFLLLALNALTLFYNFNDCIYLIGHSGKALPYELSQFVHEGTYILIASVLIAIVIVLNFFRHNLHFFPNNGKLKMLANAWLVQNIILAFLLLVRNYWYVANCGLTMKRIGVFVFIALIISVLVLCIIKVIRPKTTYFVIKNALLSLFLVMATLGFFNLETIITNYNIKNAQEQYFDMNYLMNGLSYRNIDALEKHIDNAAADSTLKEYQQQLQYKKQKMEDMLTGHSWQEWRW